MKNMKLYVLIILSALLVYSCGNSDSNKGNQANDAAVVTADNVTVQQKYPMPTSFQVTETINKAGAAYISGITNQIENIEKYFTAKSRALNLGVYGADLAYVSTYQKKQETMNYLEASKKLIDQLEITTAFNEGLVEKVEKNLENKDTLIQIISKSYYDTYEFLTQNGRDNLSLLVIAGSWIEGLYITSQVALSTKSNQEIVQIIINQKATLNDLIELLNPSSSDPSIADVLTDLNNLKVMFDQLDNPSQNEIFNNVIKKLEIIRNKIIQS